MPMLAFLIRRGLFLFAIMAVAGPLSGPLFGQADKTEAAIEKLRQMDADGDGRLSADEIPSGSRAVLAKLAEQAGVSGDEPLPLKRLERQLRREARRGGDAADSEGRGKRKKAKADREADEAKTPAEPVRAIASATQGFGASAPSGTAQGFGNEATSPQDLESRFDARTIDSTDKFMRQYDLNKNGQLDANELKKLNWSGDVKKSDRNGDGILSRTELAERMGQRFGRTRDRSATPTAKSGGFGGSSSSSGSQPAQLNDKIKAYARSFVTRYDKNKNGVLEKDEWSVMRQKYHSADANKDSVITADELAIVLGNYSRGAVSRKTATAPRAVAKTSTAKKAEPRESRSRRDRRSRDRGRDDEKQPKKSYRFLTPTERLEDSIPSKQRGEFTKLDRNGDGQIAMAEFTTSWTEKKVVEFAKMDANGDGLVTPNEYVDK